MERKENELQKKKPKIDPNILQIRLPEILIEKIDELVEKGYYKSRSDYCREVIRLAVLKDK
ncbi:MAG: hypothetical protein DRP06_01710 [Candidatus Aenigmatarchaeota archaeon]|nr:MAG: hypothetical protein DRP06_01710 [Candidatus Aenigmarchaeota archaeon]